MLRFIESQHERYLAGGLENELTDDERDMHAWITATPGAAHEMFRSGAMDRMLPPDASAINVMVCHTSARFRTSTNPTVRVSEPGNDSIFGAMFNSLRTWWLTLDPHWGAFIIAGGPAGFSVNPVPPRDRPGGQPAIFDAVPARERTLSVVRRRFPRRGSRMGGLCVRDAHNPRISVSKSHAPDPSRQAGRRPLASRARLGAAIDQIDQLPSLRLRLG